MDNDSILVSIITITYNNELTIEDTVLSILSQTYQNIEYIVIDGKSTDNTLKIVKSYEKKLNDRGIITSIVSEEDNGIADAWNKGLKRANGEIVGLLNSDDWYDDFSVERAIKVLDPKKCVVSYGKCIRVDKNKNVIGEIYTTFKPHRVYLNFGFSHTACFVTKKTYDKLGYFDTSYKIAMDVDFLLRSVKNNVQFLKTNNTTYMRMGGVSTKFRKEALKEYQAALKKNGFNFVLIFVFGILKKLILFLNK